MTKLVDDVDVYYSSYRVYREECDRLEAENSKLRVELEIIIDARNKLKSDNLILLALLDEMNEECNKLFIKANSIVSHLKGWLEKMDDESVGKKIRKYMAEVNLNAEQ